MPQLEEEQVRDKQTEELLCIIRLQELELAPLAARTMARRRYEPSQRIHRAAFSMPVAL